MPGVLTRLRDVVPIRPLSPTEALRVAELQANRLLEYSSVTNPPVPEEIITKLPRIRVERVKPVPVSAATEWSDGHWYIVVNGGEPPTRQRFSIAHEFKHILDNPFISILYPDRRGLPSARRGERACDFFAASLLMPRQWTRDAWRRGPQDVRLLASRFQVSSVALQIRLAQVGLSDQGPRSKGARSDLEGTA